MTQKDAEQINVGSEVEYRGVRCVVTSVKTGEIAGPHYRLKPLTECDDAFRRDCASLTSHRLCGLPR